MSQPITMAKIKTRKAKAYKKPKTEAARLAKLSREVSLIKKEMDNTEVKNFDVSSTPLIACGWDMLAVTNVFNPAQGVAINQRVGNEVLVSGLDLRYWLTNASTSKFGVMRVIVFLDKQNVLPVSSMLDSAGLVNTVSAPQCFYSRSNREKFVILYDKTHTLDSTENAQYFERCLIPKKWQCKLINAASTVAENQLKIVFIANETVATSSLFYSFNLRTYYTDA